MRLFLIYIDSHRIIPCSSKIDASIFAWSTFPVTGPNPLLKCQPFGLDYNAG